MTNTAVDRKGSAKGLAIREFPLQRTRNIGIMAPVSYTHLTLPTNREV